MIPSSQSAGETRTRRAWLWQTALLAMALGFGTWLLLTLLIPVKLPGDFPVIPDLKSSNPALVKLLTSTDAQARAHPNSAREVGRLGMVYHANQYYLQAESAYKIASRLDPKDYRWVYYQVLMKEENGQEKPEFDPLQRTVQLRPDYLPALQKLGDIYFKQDNLDEAARYYDRIVKFAGASPPPQALFGLGRIAAWGKDWHKVIEHLAPVSREYPRFRPPHQLLVDAYEALGQEENATEERWVLLETNLTPIPTIADPLSDELTSLCCSSTRLLKEAGLLARFGNPERAIQVARRAVEVEPDDADAHHFISRTLLESRGTDPEAVDEALAQLSEGLRLRPDDQLPLMYAAAFFFKHNKTEAATEKLRSMLARNTNNAEAHYYLGLIADRRGRTQEAIAQYEEALRGDPNYAEACHRLGLARVTEGKLDRAIAYFQKAVRLKPMLIQARCNLGVALEQQGKLSQAMEQYREALRLKPNDGPSHMFLAILLLRSGKLEEATAHFRDAVRITPGDAEARYGLGCALAGQGKIREAAEELREALRLRPNYAEAANQLQRLERKKP